MNKTFPVILSLGGSLVVPNGGINTSFLVAFNAFIRKKISAGFRFFVVVGGGATARHYIEEAKKVSGTITDWDLDWIGIHTTRLNAHLVRTIFHDIAHPRVVSNYEKKIKNLHEPLVVAAGWKPGRSTDHCAVVLAKDYGAHTIINMSNISQVYTADPKKDPQATPVPHFTWKEFEGIVGTSWSPGNNVPFDPVASKLAAEQHLRVIVLDGANIPNLEMAIDEQPGFVGTVIE